MLRNLALPFRDKARSEVPPLIVQIMFDKHIVIGLYGCTGSYTIHRQKNEQL